jgi:hypothetical protein
MSLRLADYWCLFISNEPGMMLAMKAATPQVQLADGACMSKELDVHSEGPMQGTSHAPPRGKLFRLCGFVALGICQQRMERDCK